MKSALNSTKGSSSSSEEDLNMNTESMNKNFSSSDLLSPSWWKKKTKSRPCNIFLIFFNFSSNFERLVKDLYEKNEQLKAQKAILEAFKRNVDQQKEQFETEYKEALEKKGFPRNVVLIYSEIFENQKKDDKKAKDQEDWIKNGNLTKFQSYL